MPLNNGTKPEGTISTRNNIVIGIFQELLSLQKQTKNQH